MFNIRKLFKHRPKVYCRGCKWYVKGWTTACRQCLEDNFLQNTRTPITGSRSYESCKAPQNIRIKHTYQMQVEETPFAPQYLNRNNKCKWWTVREVPDDTKV